MKRIFITAPVLFWAAMACPAAAATYSIELQFSDRVFDYDTAAEVPEIATLTGILITNGTLGYLGADDILSWSFTITDSNSALTFFSDSFAAAAPEVGAEAIWATDTTLDFIDGASWGFGYMSYGEAGEWGGFGGDSEKIVAFAYAFTDTGTGTTGTYAGRCLVAPGCLDDTPVPIPVPAEGLLMAPVLLAFAALARRRPNAPQLSRTLSQYR